MGPSLPYPYKKSSHGAVSDDSKLPIHVVEKAYTIYMMTICNTVNNVW